MDAFNQINKPRLRNGCETIKRGFLGTVEKRHIPRPLIVGIGAVLFAISVFLPYSASENTRLSDSRSGSDNMLYFAGGFSLLVLIAATIFVIPVPANILSGILERFYSALVKNEGRIAARNMKDSKNITQNITLLFISISAIIAIGVVENFVTTYISDVFHGTELQGFADGRMELEFVERVEEMEGIEKGLPVYVFEKYDKSRRYHVFPLGEYRQFEVVSFHAGSAFHG